jgi:hypothetical protein
MDLILRGTYGCYAGLEWKGNSRVIPSKRWSIGWLWSTVAHGIQITGPWITLITATATQRARTNGTTKGVEGSLVS